MDLIEINNRFPTQESCIAYLESLRWSLYPRALCPYCKLFRTTPMPKQRRHHCNICNKSFSVLTGTLFHDSKVPLQKRFITIGLMLNARKGISARQISRDIGVDKDTARSMCMRVRETMAKDKPKLSGWVQMDETYVGGQWRGKGQKIRKGKGRGTPKIPVAGAVMNKGRVAAQVIEDASFQSLWQVMNKNIEFNNSVLMTDERPAYKEVDFMIHRSINHSKGQYVDGHVHTNTIEGFWSILKRSLYGQHHRVSIGYLQNYIDETCYKYNNRKVSNLFETFMYRAVGVDRLASVNAEYKK